MVNQIILVGRLGKDPEVKTVSSGKMVAKFSVATTESWVDRDGQKQNSTEWHNIVAWGRMAEICGDKLGKGSQVYIEGKQTSRSYEDRNGNKRFTAEVQAKRVLFLDTQGGNSGQDQFPDFGGDDELPF